MMFDTLFTKVKTCSRLGVKLNGIDLHIRWYIYIYVCGNWCSCLNKSFPIQYFEKFVNPGYVFQPTSLTYIICTEQ